MPFSLASVVLVSALAATTLSQFSPGDVYFETISRANQGDVIGSDLWFCRDNWPWATVGGGSLLIYKSIPWANPPGHFLVAQLDQTVFTLDRTVSVWDGVPEYYELPGKGYDDIFTADTELSEIAPSRAGRYLVAELWNTRERGAKLIEFDVHGVLGQYRFPDLIAGDRALGATHIELLVHRLLGRSVVGHVLNPSQSFTLRFDNGWSLTVFDNSLAYESFSIQPGDIFV